MTIRNAIKLLLNKYKFSKNCIIGKNVRFCVGAICSIENSNSIYIGDNCEISAVLATKESGVISIGDNCWIGNDTAIRCLTHVEIGKAVLISSEVHISDNNNHPVSPIERKAMCEGGFHTDAWAWKHSVSAPIIIKDNVWIGERSTIMKGVTIGEGAIVAAASVVTHDVPPYCIVAGNPARVVKHLDSGNET